MPDRIPDWGVPPWRVDVAIPPASLPSRADVVVVGAGFTGLSAAYHLARAGVRPVVLEAGTIGTGASGRTGGIALEGTAAGPLPEVDDCLAFLERTTGDAGIDCDLRLPGCWTIVHVHDPGTRATLWRDGDTYVCIDDTEPGGTVDPGLLVAGLARAALRHGASLHERTRVTVVRDGSVHAGDRRVDTPHVVVALNAYATTLLPVSADVSPALTLAVCTPPLDVATLDAIGLGNRLPFYTADLPYLWGRTTHDDRLVVGSGLVFPDDGDVRRVDLHTRDTADTFARLEARVRGLHPALADVPIALRWGGPIAFRHGPPILGRHPGVRGAIVAGAYAGHGVALSVRVGALIAAAITDDRPLPAWGGFQP